MRKLFALLAIAALPLSANDTSIRTLQGGLLATGTPIHDHGIHGEGQIVAVLDTGIDYDSCYFAEADGSRPPVNTRMSDNNIDLSRRKIVAVDFLWSCDEHPGPGCDDPNDPAAWDNQGHGTHAAASIAADKGTPLVHDSEDAIAPGAKLIIQDAGYTGGDLCSQRPGIGCPVNLTPILDQAYRQGARIHSNSWGDRQGVPNGAVVPTGNYSQAARDVDAFVYAHPEMLVVFNTGNFSGNGLPPASSLSAPGCAKNTLQVGGVRGKLGSYDDIIASYTLVGPTRDGRIKPDLVGPAHVTAGDSDFDVTTHNCNVSSQPGTSWSSPTVAGAAALVRQYYTDGFYPTGKPTNANRFTPTAALLKATLIASARTVTTRDTPSSGLVAALPVPSGEQGWGFPVLDDALYFPGDAAKLRVIDDRAGLVTGESYTLRVDARTGTPLKAVLVWTDPPGVVRGTSDPTPELVNDLDLRIDGLPVVADHLNNVEAITIGSPTHRTYVITVTAAKTVSRQPYALVVTGDIAPPPTPVRAARH